MKKLMISILIITVIGLCFITNISKAASLTAIVNVEPSSTEVSAGDEVTFNFKITDIENAAQDTVTAASGIIEYDTDFFEAITEEDCSGVLNTANGNFNFAFSASADKDIGTIKLKVKSDATGSGIVKFTELAASDGEEMVYTEDEEITISIGSTQDPIDPGTNPDDPTVAPDPDDPTVVPDPEDPTETPDEPKTEEPSGSDKDVTVTVPDDKKDTTVADKEIPHAGLGSILTVAVVVVAIVGVVMFRRYRSYRDIK